MSMPGSSARSASATVSAARAGAEPQFGTDETPDHNPPHDGEELGRISNPLAKLARPLEDRADLRRSVAVRRHVRRAERIEEL